MYYVKLKKMQTHSLKAELYLPGDWRRTTGRGTKEKLQRGTQMWGAAFYHLDQWQFHLYIYLSKHIKLCTLNLCSLLYIATLLGF